MYKFSEFINESRDNKIYYHGTIEKNLNNKNRIHVGTHKAATQALEARIDAPSYNTWKLLECKKKNRIITKRKMVLS